MLEVYFEKLKGPEDTDQFLDNLAQLKIAELEGVDFGVWAEMKGWAFRDVIDKNPEIRAQLRDEKTREMAFGEIQQKIIEKMKH